jgi:hypothetical protein
MAKIRHNHWPKTATFCKKQNTIYLTRKQHSFIIPASYIESSVLAFLLLVNSSLTVLVQQNSIAATSQKGDTNV